MLDNQIAKLKSIISDEDLKEYAGDAFWGLISCVISADPVVGIVSIQDVKKLVFHFPTVIFWNKMGRFLQGTFSNYDEQVKLAARFNGDNSKYTEFVKKLIYTIDKIDDDEKVDRFANLTRCFLLTDLQPELFFKLSKFIVMCTPKELEYLEGTAELEILPNSTMVFALCQYGLLVKRDMLSDEYVLSDFAKALKQNCLNFNDGIGRSIRITGYEEMKVEDNSLRLEEIPGGDGIARFG